MYQKVYCGSETLLRSKVLKKAQNSQFRLLALEASHAHLAKKV